MLLSDFFVIKKAVKFKLLNCLILDYLIVSELVPTFFTNKCGFSFVVTFFGNGYCFITD